jgi:hypothetical protein
MKTHSRFLVGIVLGLILGAATWPSRASSLEVTNSAPEHYATRSDANGNLVAARLYDGPYAMVATNFFIADEGFLSTKYATFAMGLNAYGGGNSVSVDFYSVFMRGNGGQSGVYLNWQGDGITAIGSIFENGNQTYLTIDDVNQVITITNMPTSDPHIVNALYSVDGAVHISGG